MTINANRVDPDRRAFSPWLTVSEYPRSIHVYTDDEGFFRFEDVGFREGWVVLEKPGYGRLWLHDRKFYSPMRLDMEPAATIRGTVTDQFGNRFARSVNVRRYEGEHQTWHNEAHMSDDGSFVITDLCPGRYRVSADGRGVGKSIKQWITLRAGEDHVVEWPPVTLTSADLRANASHRTPGGRSIMMPAAPSARY